MKPILPALPVAVQPFVPDVSPPSPPPPNPTDGDGVDFEARSVDYNWPWVSDFTGGVSAQAVYTFKKRWNACDVYVTVGPGAVAKQGVLSILIFAISQSGARTLVASGRLNDAGTGTPQQTPLWIAAARAAAQRYEVAIAFWFNAAPPTADIPLRVTCVGTDLSVDPPPLLGAIRIGDGSNTGIQLVAPAVNLGVAPSIVIPSPELVGVQCVNTAAAARYLHYFEQNSNPVANGQTPEMIWPLGETAGDGIVDMAIRWRTRSRPSPGAQPALMQLVTSSTAATLTRTTDCIMQAFIR